MQTDRSIDQEQADQVRRTTGATLAARALEEVLPALGKGYGPNEHRKAAAKMSENMDKPGFTFDVSDVEIDDEGTTRFTVNSDLPFMSGSLRESGLRRAHAGALLEAAPDLYAALSDIVEQFEASIVPVGPDLADSIRVFGKKALSRAKGGV